MTPRDPLSAQSATERIDKPGLSFWGDELLHVWECPRVMKLPGGNPDFIRCGYLSHGPGNCPYDHGEDVPMVEIKALVLCSDCEEPIMRRDSRTPDGRLICGQCVMAYIGKSDSAASDERRYDAEGRPLCFECGQTQSAHPGGVECAAPRKERQ